MQFQKKEKRQTTVRFDSHHVRLRTGEIQRKTGSYMYRWTDKLGKRNTIYAATLEDLREQEEQILVDQHDGIKANIKNVTVNDVYELWCQLKRGIKDSTMKNYIYMYELFVKPTFGKKKLVQVKKSDVRRFYNQLIDDIQGKQRRGIRDYALLCYLRCSRILYADEVCFGKGRLLFRYNSS